MKKYIFTTLLAVALAAGFLASCSDDEDNSPSISLSETEVTASIGQEIAVTVTTKTPNGFGSLVVTKFHNGTQVGDEEVFTEELDADYVYTVTAEDAEQSVTTVNFKVIDKDNKTAAKDLVITVDLTAIQLMLKHNWRLDQEIWKETGTNEISDVYTDDVYRFNNDGTYNKSIGAKVDDFSDIWYNYCYYDLNGSTLKLLMSRTGAFGEKVTDTLRITMISETQLRADVTYYDLNVLDEKYDAVEEFVKVFVAVAKVSSFDPYLAGAEDDTTGPAGYCEDVVFEND
jgi:hypothetical protein